MQEERVIELLNEYFSDMKQGKRFREDLPFSNDRVVYLEKGFGACKFTLNINLTKMKVSSWLSISFKIPDLEYFRLDDDIDCYVQSIKKRREYFKKAIRYWISLHLDRVSVENVLCNGVVCSENNFVFFRETVKFKDETDLKNVLNFLRHFLSMEIPSGNS